MSGIGANKQCIYATAEQNLFKVESVKGNGLKKVLVIGYEGAGKSKLCNYLAGYESDVLFYKEGGSSGRGYLQLADVFYRGEEDKPISVIKTPGLKRPNGDVKRSAENMDMIKGIVEELRRKADVISSVLIIDDGKMEFNGALVGLLNVLADVDQLHGTLGPSNSGHWFKFNVIGQTHLNYPKTYIVPNIQGHILRSYALNTDDTQRDKYELDELWKVIGYAPLA